MSNVFAPSYLSAVTLLALTVGGGGQPAFHPEEDLLLSKHFEVTALLELDELSLTVDGTDVSEMAQIGGLEMEASVNLGLTDEYREVEDGRVLQLVRTFQELVLAYDSGNESATEEMDEIEGVEVSFTWDEDLEEYRPFFTDESAHADEEILLGLIADMDFRALLPDGEVSVGDTWEVPDDRIQGVLIPGLKVSKVAALAQADGALSDDLVEQIMGIAGGLAMECELAEEREEAGVSVSVIKVTLTGDGSMEIASMLKEALDIGEGIKPEFDEAALEFSLEGEGELLWDCAAGHMVAFSMEAELEVELSVTASIEVEGDTHHVEAGALVAGELGWNASLETD